MAKIRLELDAGAILRKADRGWRRNLPMIADQILADCNRYVRVDQGQLEQSSYTASELDKGRLVWNTPYARRVFYTGSPSKAVNPNASLRWCEKAKSKHAGEWALMVKKRLGGNT